MFKLKILTPTKTLYDDSAENIVLTTEEGQIEFQSGHSNHCGSIMYSVIEVEKNNNKYMFSVRRGITYFSLDQDTCFVYALSGDLLDAKENIDPKEYLKKLNKYDSTDIEEMSSYKVKYIENEKLSILKELEN